MSSVMRILEFLAELDSIVFSDIESYRKAVNRLCKKELAYLRIHTELTTLRRYRTDYRNAIRKHYQGKQLPTVYLDKSNKGNPTHIAVKYFTLKRSEVKQYESYETTRKDSYLDVFSDNRLVINNHLKMIDIAIGLLSSDSAYDITAGLLLLTGRRTVEIWKTGQFELINNKPNSVVNRASTPPVVVSAPLSSETSPPNLFNTSSIEFTQKVGGRDSANTSLAGSENLPPNLFNTSSIEFTQKVGGRDSTLENLVVFSGQAKTRGSEKAKKSYPIFILHNSKLICNALAKLRSIKDFTNATEREVNAATSARLSRVVKKHFNGFVANYDGLIEGKDLRAIYVHIAHSLHSPHSVITEFAEKMLGHVVSSTADNYMLFRLSNIK